MYGGFGGLGSVLGGAAPGVRQGGGLLVQAGGTATVTTPSRGAVTGTPTYGGNVNTSAGTPTYTVLIVLVVLEMFLMLALRRTFRRYHGG